MSSKWQYATIPAEQRLNMLKEGNEALYKEELARTQDVIVNRLEAGLDVKDQMDWADTVSYNYELGKAQNSGGSVSDIPKTGYAQQLFGNLSVSTSNGTSSVSNPKNVTNTYGTSQSTTESKLRSAYQKGVNERAGILNNEYATYVDSLNAEYEKRKKEVIKEYERLEKLYAENSVNNGYSQYGGRSLTDKISARENLVNTLAALDSEKNGLILDAQNKLRAQLMEVTDIVAKTISDEYYKYQNLLSDQEALEYQKMRDAANDDFKWQQFLYSKERDGVKDSFDQQDYLLNLAKFERQKEENDKEYEARMKEYEADNAYRYQKLADDKELSYAKLFADYSENAENTENENGETEQKKFGKKYIDHLNMAINIVSAVKNNGDGYTKAFSDKELLNWIKSFELSQEEKEKICKEVGIKFS